MGWCHHGISRRKKQRSNNDVLPLTPALHWENGDHFSIYPMVFSLVYWFTMTLAISKTEIPKHVDKAMP
jgi:hypothetical protein